MSLDVSVSDGSLSATQTIAFVIDSVNDAPVIGVLPDLSGTEDTAFTTTLSSSLFTDVDGDALTVGVRSG